jgi:hypothetical protein
VLPPRAVLQSRPLVLAGLDPAIGPVVVRLFATDALGRQLTGWATLEGPGGPDVLSDPQPLATTTP